MKGYTQIYVNKKNEKKKKSNNNSPINKSKEYSGEAEIEYSVFVKAYETSKYIFLYLIVYCTFCMCFKR